MDIKHIIDSGNNELINKALEEYTAIDIAELYYSLSQYERISIFNTIDVQRAASAFCYIDIEEQKFILQNIDKECLTSILNTIPARKSADLFYNIPSSQVNILLKNIEKTKRQKIIKLLTLNPKNVGSIMNLEYITLSPCDLVSDAIKKIKQVNKDIKSIYSCYVIDENSCLLGVVRLIDLLYADCNNTVSEIMLKKFISLKISDSKQKASYIFRKYGLQTVPVVENNKLIGEVKFSNIFSVIENSATEDIHKMAGINITDRAYFSKGIWEHARDRVSWIFILMLIALSSVYMIVGYSKYININTLVLACLPMIMGISGNIAIQSSSTIARYISIGDLKFSDSLKVLWIEFRTALLISTILAIVAGFNLYLVYENIAFALIIAVSIILVVIISNLIAAMLPLLANKLKIEPTKVAMPIIITLIDIIAILIYFSVLLKVNF